ncbi:MAG TPA: MlaD family protein [Candidatus Hydrogenedentes bacterium]|nr:MlaD family protein [Candidatus Hydrogenedentota bacterium]HOL77117.1 MlaD family protein [Candidatus Hydrogenedentota bacterium]HPO86964.1 MlaD family protein [Candidatus Hydrogenedentota bacterium]
MADDRNRYTSAEIKAGLLVLTSMILFLLFFAAIRGIHPTQPRAVYHAYFTDIGGLNLGAPVRFGGYKVGRVNAIAIDKEQPSRIRVDFELPPDVPVNDASRAFVGQVSLTSEKHLEITTGDVDAPKVSPGSEIPTQRKDLFGLAGEVGGKVGDVLDRVKELLEKEGKDRETEKPVTVPGVLENIDGAVSDLRDVMQENRGDIKEVLARLPEIEDTAKKLIQQLQDVVHENREDLRATVSDARATAASAREAMTKIEGIAGDAAKVAARLEGMADDLQTILTNASEASADMRDILQENKPRIEDIIAELREAARYARGFAHEIMEQPQSLIRGVKPQGRESR